MFIFAVDAIHKIGDGYFKFGALQLIDVYICVV